MDIVNDAGEVENVLAVDNRYMKLSSFSEPPNEMHIQHVNKVYDKLAALPNFAEEVPNA